MYKDTGKDYITARNNYKQAYEKFKKQHPNLAIGGETIGGLTTEELILGYATNLLKSGIDYTRILKEQKLLKKAYDKVKENPSLGTRTGKDDVVVKIKPIRDKNVYVIHRGAAIKRNGKTYVQDSKPDTYLFDATGTKNNFGLSKMIYKHDLTKEEVAQIPKLLRKFNPYGQRIDNKAFQWKTPLDKDNNAILSFVEKENNELKELTVHKAGVKKYKKIAFSQKRK